MAIRKSTVEKIFSGRYLLTICAGAMFIFATITGILPSEAIVAIVLSVFKDYFNQSKDK